MAQRPDPRSRLHAFQGKLNARVNWARGLFVSYSGFTQDGLTAYGRGGSVVCMDGLDLHDALQGEIPLNHVLEHKVRRSVETGEVLARVRDLFPTSKSLAWAMTEKRDYNPFDRFNDRWPQIGDRILSPGDDTTGQRTASASGTTD